jgi:hypothetical protein
MQWEPTLAGYRRMHTRLLPERDVGLRKLLRDVMNPSGLYCELLNHGCMSGKEISHAVG